MDKRDDRVDKKKNKKNKTTNILLIIAVVLIIAAVIYKTVYDKSKPEEGIGNTSIQGSQNGNESQGNNESENQAENEEEKYFAPDFTLKDIEGNKKSLSDYRGKIVVLNFWAIGCGYCVQELPDFNEASSEFEKGSDAIIVTINLGDTVNSIKKFMSDNGLKLNVLIDSDGSVGNTYGVPGIPTTFVVNKDGTMYGYHVGPLTKEQLLSVIKEIK